MISGHHITTSLWLSPCCTTMECLDWYFWYALFILESSKSFLQFFCFFSREPRVFVVGISTPANNDCWLLLSIMTNYWDPQTIDKCHYAGLRLIHSTNWSRNRIQVWLVLPDVYTSEKLRALLIDPHEHKTLVSRWYAMVFHWRREFWLLKTSPCLVL